MKKVKIALSVLAVFAVVGGALAFKAKSTSFLYVHEATDLTPGRCTLQSFAITTNPLLGNKQQIQASTTTLASGCVKIDVYDGE